jgi:hypothetical protein
MKLAVYIISILNDKAQKNNVVVWPSWSKASDSSSDLVRGLGSNPKAIIISFEFYCVELLSHTERQLHSFCGKSKKYFYIVS